MVGYKGSENGQHGYKRGCKVSFSRLIALRSHGS